MKPGIQSHLNDHSYPALLMRYPQWIRLLHAWNNLVLQRNWLSNSTLRRLLSQFPTGSIVLDAGSGDGQHVFTQGRRFKHLQFWGLDKNENNIDFCKKLAARLPDGPQHFHFFHQQLEEIAFENKTDLVNCIGTLQYIPDDRKVLANFYKSLKNKGLLLIYVPVNGRMVLHAYRHFLKKLNHYEKSQQRQRVYSPDEILEKIESAGFKLREQHFTYGTPGVVGHEIYSLMLIGLGNLGGWAWMILPFCVILMPLVLLLKTVDYFLPKKNGNGLLIVAEKTP